MIKKINLLCVFVFFMTAASADMSKQFSDEYVSFSYPDDFEVSQEQDSDTYFYYIDGPNTTSVMILYFAGIDIDMDAYIQYVHEELMSIPEADPEKLKIEMSDTEIEINGSLRSGKSLLYAAKSLFDKSKFSVSFYKLESDRGSYVVQEERRNKYIEKHQERVEEIIKTISVPD